MGSWGVGVNNFVVFKSFLFVFYILQLFDYYLQSYKDYKAFQLKFVIIKLIIIITLHGGDGFVSIPR